eukprot:m.335281 g.335281  ORF g.335281 m.335281 type:complete len:255 (+) comp17561_c0_seq1:17-781(+)
MRQPPLSTSVLSVLFVVSFRTLCLIKMAMAVQVITGINRDLTSLEKKLAEVHQETVSCLTECSEFLTDTQLAEMKNAVSFYAKLDLQTKANVKVVSDIGNKIKYNQYTEDLGPYHEYGRDQIEAEINKITDKAVEEHTFVQSMKSELVDAGMEQEENVDDDLFVSQATILITCPITSMVMQNPVKCKKCKHHYEKAAIFQALAKTGKVKCPLAGCHATVTKSDLVEDKLFKKKIEKLQSQQEEAGTAEEYTQVD